MDRDRYVKERRPDVAQHLGAKVLGLARGRLDLEKGLFADLLGEKVRAHVVGGNLVRAQVLEPGRVGAVELLAQLALQRRLDL